MASKDHAENQSDGSDWEDWVEEDVTNCPCLFCDTEVAGAVACVKHCDAVHHVDLAKVHSRLNMYMWISCVNYVRKMHVSADAFCKLLSSGEQPWADEAFLRPVLSEDPLLQWEPDDGNSDEEEAQGVKESGSGSDERSTKADIDVLQNRLLEAESRAAAAEQELQRVLTDLAQVRKQASVWLVGDEPGAAIPAKLAKSNDDSDDDDNGDTEQDPYFLSYANVAIHREMLQDEVRTRAYQDFIMSNKAVFKDKVVLDIGCGTGILSMFAAAAGARKVIAVDQSSICYQAMANVRENNLQDVIHVVHGRVEEVDLEEKVDIIISEWMGYFLLFESMLDSVLAARDKWLAPGGAVYPRQFSVHLVAVANSHFTTHLDYWNNVYGFKMSSMRESNLLEADVLVVDEQSVISDTATVKVINANSAQVKELDFTSPFVLTFFQDGTCNALAGYFDTAFSGGGSENEVTFSCSPRSPPTHWKQTVFLLREPLNIEKGWKVEGEIVCSKQQHHQRALHVNLKFDVLQRDGSVSQSLAQQFVIQ